MIRFLRKIHNIYYLAVTVVFFYIYYPLLHFSIHPKRHRLFNKFRALAAATPMFLSGMLWNIRYEEKIKRNKNYIFCVNHTSFLDISLMSLVGNGNHFFLAKDELKNNRILNIFFKGGDIPVKRESAISAYRAFQQVAKKLDEGKSLIIFPEGGINDEYPPKVQTFKNGAFKLAIEKNIPIIPVTISNSWKLYFDDAKLHGSRPGVIDVFVHKPIDTTDFKVEQEDELNEMIKNIITKKFN